MHALTHQFAVHSIGSTADRRQTGNRRPDQELSTPPFPSSGGSSSTSHSIEQHAVLMMMMMAMMMVAVMVAQKNVNKLRSIVDASRFSDEFIMQPHGGHTCSNTAALLTLLPPLTPKHALTIEPVDWATFE